MSVEEVLPCLLLRLHLLLLLVLLAGFELRQVMRLLQRQVAADAPAEMDGAVRNSRWLPCFSSPRRSHRRVLLVDEPAQAGLGIPVYI